MKRALIVIACCSVALLVSSVRAQEPEAAELIEKPAPRIQVALLLDNSGSMSGLIEQAKAQLWTFINEFATATKDGKNANIQVALYTYGNPPPKMLLALTNDLDMVSKKLFEIAISGSKEYCGQVIETAVNDLKWSTGTDDLKVIFIAGNEPFTQGPVDYRQACKTAIAKGIIVNTIHCQSYKQGITGKWQEGALLADGSYMNIDQNAKIVHITAPQDKEIARLGKELNTTYLPYGKKGREGKSNQGAQDTNAGSVSAGNNVARQVSKASVQYRNTSWDLVDAVKEGVVKLAEVKEDDLPENMQKMSAEERVAHLEAQEKKRTEIKNKINDLAKARKEHVAKERAKQATTGKDTLDEALIKTVRAQAVKKNFTME